MRLNACRRTGFKTSKHSLIAFGEPGKLMIKHFPRIPLIPRESIAIGVASKDRRRSSSEIPGVSRSITRFVASGVLSRGVNPVPPVVMISSESSDSRLKNRLDLINVRPGLSLS
jgi:hypothetical protein